MIYSSIHLFIFSLIRKIDFIKNKKLCKHTMNMRKLIILLLPAVWFVVHWIAPRIYIPLCVPDGMYGFIQSLFLTTSPHCVALRYVVSMSCFNINYAWMTLGTTLMGYMSTHWDVQKPKVL
jgi:hypothetical protein|tara:strand:- start:537 stop:899 length:363 start_codon:yes stop_codon:yes gene_type:complete